MNLLLLGPQGSGKGTQAKRIASEYGAPAHLDRARCSAPRSRRAPSSGARVEPILDARRARPRRADDRADPRAARRRTTRARASSSTASRATLAQAEALDAMLREIGRALDAIFFFEVPDDVALERIARRAREEGRADDTPEAIARRLADLPRADRAARRALPRDRQARRRCTPTARSTRSSPRSRRRSSRCR